MNTGVLFWARRELRRRWAPLALLFVLVAVGGGATITATAGARRTETAFPRMLDATNEPNIGVLGVDDSGFFDLDPALLDEVMQIDGVTGAVEFAWMTVAPTSFPNFFSLAIVDRRGESLRPLWLEGTEPHDLSELAADVVIMNEAMIDQVDQRFGDTVTLESLTPEQMAESLDQQSTIVPGGPAMDVRIVGISRGPEDVSDAPDPFLLLPPAFYDKYHDSIGSCMCNVLVNADPRSIDAVEAHLAEIYPNATIEGQEDFESRISDTVALQHRAWLLIALAAAAAGIVTLYLACSRVGRLVLAGDATRAALGMTNLERRLGRLLVMVPSMVFGAIGAVCVAYLLSPLSPVGLTRLAEPDPGFRWEPTIVIAGAAIVLVLALAIAAVASLTSRDERASRRTAGWRVGPALAFGNRLAFGHGRGAIIGVFLSSAGLVGALTLQHSIDRVLVTPALYGADFHLTNLLDSGSDKRALAEQLVPDPDLEAVAIVWVQLPSAPLVHVVGPGGEADVDPNAFESIKGTISIKQTEGRSPGRPDEVVIGAALMEQLGVRIGDRITAGGYTGDVELAVVGDNLDPGVDLAGAGFSMTLDGLRGVIEPRIGGAVARFAPGADQAAGIDRYSTLGFTPVVPPSEVGNIGQLGGLPARVGQLLALLGIGALVNAIVLTVRLGRREVALHRALGFTSRQVVTVYIWQGVITTLIGVVVGGSVGFVAGRAINRELVGNVGAIAETVLPGVVWSVVAGTVLFCLGASTIAGVLALHRRPGLELRTE
ncbi:MAG: ABC transporter permease [Ilumatobacteraceae bacterium]